MASHVNDVVDQGQPVLGHHHGHQQLARLLLGHVFPGVEESDVHGQRPADGDGGGQHGAVGQQRQPRRGGSSLQ